MPSPTSNNSSPREPGPDNDATREFLERERASLEAINAMGMHSASGEQVTDGSQEAIAKDVAGLAITSPSQEENPFTEAGNQMDVDEPASSAPMQLDHSLQQESEKIAKWRKERATVIARREEESDRQRQESRRRAQTDLASFLADYAAKVEARRQQPVDPSAYQTEFDGNGERRGEQPAALGPAEKIDWVAVQRLVKLLPPPGNANADRFLQIVNSMAEKRTQAM